jgi:hypothetical protein
MGAPHRLIQSVGETYTVRNASGGAGGRDRPNYSDDGTLVGVIERRGLSRTLADSAGEEIDADLELRAVPDDGVSITPAGQTDSYPTKLVGPNDTTYRVLDSHVEDGGVTVLTVVLD